MNEYSPTRHLMEQLLIPRDTVCAISSREYSFELRLRIAKSLLEFIVTSCLVEDVVENLGFEQRLRNKPIFEPYRKTFLLDMELFLPALGRFVLENETDPNMGWLSNAAIHYIPKFIRSAFPIVDRVSVICLLRKQSRKALLGDAIGMISHRKNPKPLSEANTQIRKAFVLRSNVLRRSMEFVTY